MSRIDSGFGRLADAWKMNLHLPHGRLRKPWCITGDSMFGSDGPRSRSAALGLRRERPTALHTTQVAFVMVALAPDGNCAPLVDGATALSSRRDRLYRIGAVLPSGIDDLERLLREQTPRVLLLGVRLIDALGVDAVRRLRRHHRAGDWLLGWDKPSSHGFELAIQCQAKGCVEWNMSAARLIDALDAVLAGELWFPRRVMQTLYMTLLEAARDDAAPGTCSLPCGAQPLTVREAEALALMREGLTNKQIAERLGISINTVKKHLEHAFEKRGLHGRRQLLG
jgi:DNA-binding NarL/FixJ family response regulator